MKNLYKATMYRIFKNIYFIGGCVIALVVTLAVTGGFYTFPFLMEKPEELRMIFVGAAMVLFFSMFPPLFINPDYIDGCIRNRIIAGYSQKQVYISHVLAQLSAMTIMFLCYLIGGIIGGASLNASSLVAVIVLFVAVMSYTVLTATAAFRLKKLIASMLTTMLLFNLCFNMVLFGNAILSALKDTAFKIGSVLYNVNALGQWFCLTGFVDDGVNPGAGIQILLSLIVIAAALIWGLSGLDKRDLN